MTTGWEYAQRVDEVRRLLLLLLLLLLQCSGQAVVGRVNEDIRRVRIIKECMYRTI
jgi:hypothetical protein